MSRILPLKFSMPYRIRFFTNIRGHHVYKSLCKPEKSEKLECHKDDRDEASMYDNHATGVYKREKGFTLVSRVPIECSTLVDNFLNAHKENRLASVVTGKGKREVGLVVAAEFTGRTKKRNVATILCQELDKKKEKFSGHFGLNIVEYNRKMYSSILQLNICLFT